MLSGLQLTGYQLIDSQGNKKFVKGSKLQSSFYPIGLNDSFTLDDCSFFLLGEGYATVASVYQVLNEHFESCLFAGIIAFSAANLMPVYEKLRKKQKVIYLLIDNDNKPDKLNIGFNESFKIISKYKADKLIPLLPPSSKACDWNEWINKHGNLIFIDFIEKAILNYSEYSNDK